MSPLLTAMGYESADDYQEAMGTQFYEYIRARVIKPGKFKEPVLNISADTSVSGGMAVRVDVPGLHNVLSFNLERYPACCGAMLFHHFSVSRLDLPQPQFDTLMDWVFKEVHDYDQKNGSDMYFNNKRYILVMVEFNHPEVVQARNSGEDGWRNTLRLSELSVTPAPKVQHQAFWNYFHNKAARITDRQFFNINSDNVCHELEVVFN